MFQFNFFSRYSNFILFFFSLILIIEQLGAEIEVNVKHGDLRVGQ